MRQQRSVQSKKSLPFCTIIGNWGKQLAVEVISRNKLAPEAAKNIQPHIILYCTATAPQYIQQRPSNLKAMYNTFLAQKHHKSLLQSLHQEKKLQAWQQTYKQSVQPSLVNKYQRRINGFAKKMEDEPVVVRQMRDGDIDQALLRRYDRGSHVGNGAWKFKNSEDWKSIYTPSERLEREMAVKASPDKEPTLALRNIWSQSKYENKRIEFRLREKEKDINPPMKYTSKDSTLIALSLPKIRNKYTRRNYKTDMTKKKALTEQCEDDNVSEGASHNVSYVDFDTISNNQSSFFRRNPEHRKTEEQLREEQEMKALAQNKLYFKGLIDLEQHVRTAKERNQIKDVLVKCGIFKPISGKVYEEEDIDRFLELMKTRQ